MRKLQGTITKFNNARILDIGTGNGSFIGRLVALNNSFDEIIGIDILDSQIDIAKKNFEDKRIKFYKMDIFDNNFEEHSFDIICLSNTLHHLKDIKKTIKVMESLLKDKGIIIFSEMCSNGLNKAQKSHLMIHHFAAEIDRSFGEIHHDTFKDKEIIKKIQENTTLKIVDAWDMLVPPKDKTSQEELDWLNTSLDRLVLKAHDDDKEHLTKKAIIIRKHFKKHGFESASTLVVIVSSFKPFTSIKEMLR
ncbi:MAG: class I SAM-dependent methyltransferase [Candidatus Izemoplasma sp.]